MHNVSSAPDTGSLESLIGSLSPEQLIGLLQLLMTGSSSAG